VVSANFDFYMTMTDSDRNYTITNYWPSQNVKIPQIQGMYDKMLANEKKARNPTTNENDETTNVQTNGEKSSNGTNGQGSPLARSNGE
jgi:hypothetical protein